MGKARGSPQYFSEYSSYFRLIFAASLNLR